MDDRFEKAELDLTMRRQEVSSFSAGEVYAGLLGPHAVRIAAG